ncbi:hypothetical protein HID58_055602, partial [Brassica napus]
LGRSPNWAGPARRTAELNPSRVQLGRSPNWTGPARRTAELNPCWVQLGRSPNWSGPARRTVKLNLYPLLSSLPLKGKIMSSRRKSSTKSRHDRSLLEGSSSQYVGVVQKVEFPAEPIDPEEVDAWRTTMEEVKPPCPPPSIRFPRDWSPFQSYYAGVHAFGRTFPRSGFELSSRPLPLSFNF